MYQIPKDGITKDTNAYVDPIWLLDGQLEEILGEDFDCRNSDDNKGNIWIHRIRI